MAQRKHYGGPFKTRVVALRQALTISKPQIFNTDQGCQFTSGEWLDVLTVAGIAISMDGQGRVFDNIFVERLWRTVKYEEVYLKGYGDVDEARQSLGGYLRFYNQDRLHQALGYRTPSEVYFGCRDDTGGRAVRRTLNRAGVEA